MMILEKSKILMYDLFYNQMKARYGLKCKLIYTDTDSQLMKIKTDDIFKDMTWWKTLFQRASALQQQK